MLKSSRVPVAAPSGALQQPANPTLRTAGGAVNRETIRLLLIVSTVVAAALSFWFGVPRILDWTTPELQRVWVVSSSLGDQIASAAPKEVLAGAPVTLYAVVETGTGSRRRFYGPVDRVRLGGEGAEIVDVRPWSTWWNELEVLWFKVEPVYAFDNEAMVDDFDPATILYTDSFMLAWGFPRSTPRRHQAHRRCVPACRCRYDAVQGAGRHP